MLKYSPTFWTYPPVLLAMFRQSWIKCRRASTKFTWIFKTYTYNNPLLYVTKIQKTIRRQTKCGIIRHISHSRWSQFVLLHRLVIFTFYCITWNLPYGSHTTTTEPSAHCTTDPVTEECCTLDTGTNVCKYYLQINALLTHWNGLNHARIVKCNQVRTVIGPQS